MTFFEAIDSIVRITGAVLIFLVGLGLAVFFFIMFLGAIFTGYGIWDFLILPLGVFIVVSAWFGFQVYTDQYL